MKTSANLIIAALPRSGVWGADDCGEPNNLLAVSDKCQEKLPQQFSEPTSDFLVWGRSPCAVASRQTKRGYPRQRESEIALRRDSNRSGIFRQEKICDEGGSLGFRGAPQTQCGAITRACVQQAAQNTDTAASSGATACLVRSSETNFSPKKSAFELPHTIANSDCYSKSIGDSNHE
jgi:hypothetical protein